jgi:diadenosine tetraphosphatase ApaH/serine/threonine PP2A family protein phosphatase
MLLRVITDIHSNLQALEAVLTDPPGASADSTLCLGDVVGYGADPARCIQLIRENCRIVVRGNHDAGAAGQVSLDRFNWEGATAIRWTRSVLGHGEIKWLSLLPHFFELQEFFLCHSYPADPESWTYVLRRNQALASINAREGQISLIGHTHLPGVWSEDGSFSEIDSGDFSRARLINVGSVGQPRDRDPRAAYLLIDTERRTWEHRRVEYSIEDAAARIREESLPEVLWQRLYRGT